MSYRDSSVTASRTFLPSLALDSMNNPWNSCKHSVKTIVHMIHLLLWVLLLNLLTSPHSTGPNLTCLQARQWLHSEKNVPANMEFRAWTIMSSLCILNVNRRVFLTVIYPLVVFPHLLWIGISSSGWQHCGQMLPLSMVGIPPGRH